MSVATSRSPRAALHRKPARRLPSSASTQSTASRHPGPFQCSQRAAASRAKYAGVPVARPLERARLRQAGPRRTGGSSRTGCSGCASAAWSATTSDLRTSESRCRSTSTSSAPSTTAQMLVRSKPPANTDVRAQQVALVVGQQVVGPLHRVAQRRAGAPGPASSPSTAGTGRRADPCTSTALIAAIRAAASSMPSGSPSSVSQISITAAAVSRVLQPEVGPDRAGPVDEQRDRVGGHAALERQRRHGRAPSRRRPAGTRATSRGS